MISGCTMLPDCKKTKLGSSSQEVSPSTGKNTREALLPCCTWKCVPIAISGGMDILVVPRCHFFRQTNSQ